MIASEWRERTSSENHLQLQVARHRTRNPFPFLGGRLPNDTARNTNFGSGEYPTSPSPTYDQVTAVGDPRSWQLAARLRF